MFDPKPKLHDGSRRETDAAGQLRVSEYDDTAICLDATAECLLVTHDGKDTCAAFPEDALAVLRPVDPVWLAALEVVRAQDALPDVAPESALEIALALAPIGQAIRKLRAAMLGEKGGE